MNLRPLNYNLAIFVTLPLLANLVQGAETTSQTSIGQPNHQMTDVLSVYDAVAGTAVTKLVPREARQQFSAEDAAKVLARVTKTAEDPQDTKITIDGMVIPTPAGDLPIRIYKPLGVTGTPPVVVYFHGGGFVVATIDTYDASGRALADASGAIVVSVEYRKAPEHPFPSALHDALWSYQWVLKNAGIFGGDADRVGVAGESAGGNLATEICLHAKPDGFKMPLVELLIYPETDFNVNYPSDTIYANAQPLNLAGLLYFTKYYLTDPSQANDIDASPLRADLHGLPPTTIIAAQVDPLQDEGRAYADKLKSADVRVHYQLFPGTTHEFFGMVAVLNEAKEAVAVAGADLKRSFGP